jgi:hypothetical protein
MVRSDSTLNFFSRQIFRPIYSLSGLRIFELYMMKATFHLLVLLPNLAPYTKKTQKAAHFWRKKLESFPCSNGDSCSLTRKAAAVQRPYTLHCNKHVQIRHVVITDHYWSCQKLARNAKIFNCRGFTGLIHHNDRVAKPKYILLRRLRKFKRKIVPFKVLVAG